MIQKTISILKMIDRDNDIENDTSIKNDRDNDIENDAKGKNDSDNIKLTKAEKRIINIIIQNPHITTNQLCKQATVSSTTVSRSIKKLKDIGYIKRIGSDRDGYWEIIKQNSNGRILILATSILPFVVYNITVAFIDRFY